jgi:hypothetical protein
MSSVMLFVSAVRRSTRFTQLLKEACGKSLLGLSKTRWMAAYFVLSRLVRLREHLEPLAVTNARNMPIYVHWNQIESMLELLRPGHQAILALEGRK